MRLTAHLVFARAARVAVAAALVTGALATGAVAANPAGPHDSTALRPADVQRLLGEIRKSLDDIDRGTSVVRTGVPDGAADARAGAADARGPAPATDDRNATAHALTRVASSHGAATVAHGLACAAPSGVGGKLGPPPSAHAASAAATDQTPTEESWNGFDDERGGARVRASAVAARSSGDAGSAGPSDRDVGSWVGLSSDLAAAPALDTRARGAMDDVASDASVRPVAVPDHTLGDATILGAPAGATPVLAPTGPAASKGDRADRTPSEILPPEPSAAEASLYEAAPSEPSPVEPAPAEPTLAEATTSAPAPASPTAPPTALASDAPVHATHDTRTAARVITPAQASAQAPVPVPESSVAPRLAAPSSTSSGRAGPEPAPVASPVAARLRANTEDLPMPSAGAAPDAPLLSVALPAGLPPEAAVAAPDAAAAALGAGPVGTDKPVLMNFKDTSIDSILVFLSELLDITFVKDEAVSGTVTIINPRKMSASEAINTLEAALALKGFSLVRLNKAVYQVMPTAKASSKGQEVVTDRRMEGGERFVTRVVKLRYTSPQAMLPVLEKLLTQDERVGPHVDSSSIVISAAASNADRLVSILGALDQPATEGCVVELVPLKYLSPSQAQELVSRVFGGAAVTEPGTPPQPGTYRMVPVPGRNALIVVAPGARLHQVIGFLKSVDGTDLSGERRLELYPLKVASAAKLAPFIQSMLTPGAGGQGGQGGQGGGEGRGPEFRGGPVIVADTVTNQIMVLANDEIQKIVRRLLATLDYEGFLSFRTRVFELQYARAAGLVDELEKIANRPGVDPGGQPPVIVADKRLNRLIISTQNAALLKSLSDLVEGLDRPGSTEDLVTHVYYLSHAPAKSVAALLKDLYGQRPTGGGGGGQPQAAEPPGGPGGAGGGQGQAVAGESVGSTAVTTDGGAAVPTGSIKVVADDLTNSLVILSTEQAYQQIVRTLEQLDVDPLQVLVEVVIAEVQLTRDHRFGMDLAFTSSNNDIRTDFGNLNADHSPNTALSGLRAFIISDDNFRQLINAFHERDNSNVLATPKLFANNNQEASILIGRQVPVITGQTVTSGGNTINTVEYKDIGTKLNMTPQINRKRSVTLKLSQEVKTIVGTGVQNNPIIDTREARTTATVNDGQAVLIGGLLEDQDTHRERYVPGLGQVPLLRYLFRSRDRQVFKQELIFVFRPHVVNGEMEANSMSQDNLHKSVFKMQLKDGMPTSQLPYDRRHRDP